MKWNGWWWWWWWWCDVKIDHTQRMIERTLLSRWVVGNYFNCTMTYTACDLDGAVPGSPPQNVRARPVSSNTVVVQWDEPKLSNGVIRVHVSLCLTSSNLKRQLFRPHRLHAVHRCGLLLRMSHARSVVCVSVCVCMSWAHGWAVQKRSNGSTCRFGADRSSLTWVQGTMY